MPLAWVSCAGSRFRGTNREFVQSNECEAAGVCRVTLTLAAVAVAGIILAGWWLLCRVL